MANWNWNWTVREWTGTVGEWSRTVGEWSGTVREWSGTPPPHLSQNAGKTQGPGIRHSMDAATGPRPEC